MQFITGLFGGSGNTILTMIFALGIVVVLILLAVWLLKLISGLSSTAVRGRNKRLAVVDTLALDQKRQLLIVRRDDVEHLILVGGPQDVVVETGIAVVEAPPAPSRRPLPTAPAPKSTTVAAAPQPAIPVAPTPVASEPARPAGRSLRYTGLLRPVGPQDATVSVQNPDSLDGASADSAKENGNEAASEGTALENQNGDQANRN